MAITIRKAVTDDFDFVCELMIMALEPFYGGDHRAHAQRIFNTHISGGVDRVGHFSEGQCIFVITEGDEQLGMINLVSKKQGTYKISPLIVSPANQGRGGYGSVLLSHVEEFARSRGARQIYCTVAEKNTSALQFFMRKGYVVAGSSESHYKAGITEVMLYKLFLPAAEVELFDKPDISVLPFDERHAQAVRALILEKLPTHFNGVDDAWVDALFEGYERRQSGDVNTKYKLIFTATDRYDRVLGVIGATPKKGEPVKIMPCVAFDIHGFTALLVETPNLLSSYGRKLYVHIAPTADEVIILQRLGWRLDAVMPGAYHEEVVTQQWGYTLGSSYMRIMRVKQRFIDSARARQKRLEVRVGYNNIHQIGIGERIRMLSRTDELHIRVVDIRTYENFESMADSEDMSLIIPGASRKEALRQLMLLYPRDKERLGVYVLEIEPV